MKLNGEYALQVTIKPGRIAGTIAAPASKSAMQRACALALLHNGQTIIGNPGISNDDKAALSIIQSLGATVEPHESGLIICGSAFYASSFNAPVSVFCAESGLSIRMFTPVASLSAGPVQVSGSGSLLRRPMHFFDEVLPRLAVQVNSRDGYLPLQLQGPLQAKEISIDGSLSSQFLTGLLIAFARAAKAPVRIYVNDLKSKPYIDLTLQMMRHFGYQLSHHNYEYFDILPKVYDTVTIHYTVEGDWSGAAFLLVAAAIAGSIVVRGLDVSSTQADKEILQVLSMTEARLSITTDEISVQGSALKPFQFDATDCPDLFPPLVALAAYCKGKSVIAGVQRLAHKESNRALTLQEEFAKMGLHINLQDDLMIIDGGKGLHGAVVQAHHDHRIAMALAVAALGASGDTLVENAEAVNKSYPMFYQHLQQLGAGVFYAGES